MKRKADTANPKRGAVSAFTYKQNGLLHKQIQESINTGILAESLELADRMVADHFLVLAGIVP